MYRSKFFILALCTVFPLRFIAAQDTLLSLQQLSWAHDEYALRYEVEIEKQEEGVYRQLQVIYTDSPLVMVYLSQGNYRYRVTPYNLLNRPGIVSAWLDFEITTVVLPDTSYDTEEIEKEDIAEEEIAHEPEIPLEESRHIFNFYIGASYLTLINIHGEEDWMSASGQFLSGAALHLGIVSSNFNFFNLGVELVPAWYSFSDEAQSLLLECNFLLQKEFFERKADQRKAAALVLRTGAGVNMDFNDPENETALYVNIGISCIWFPVQRFYLEAGVNYSYLFAIENPTGRLRPFAGGGLRFGR